MYFDLATKKQLLQIALYEPCSLEYKFEACRELQMRQWHDSMLHDLIRLWGNGISVLDLSIKLGLPIGVVQHQLTKYDLWKRRVGA